VKIDPAFAEAYAELALSYILAQDHADLDGARQSLDRALQLKPRLLRARAVQGLWLMEQDPPDLVGAERVLREVLAQDPNMTDALLWLANSLSVQGREDETRPIHERAALVDPLHASVAANLAGQLFNEGKYDEAKRIVDRQLAQPSPGWIPYASALGFYSGTGQLVEVNTVAKSAVLHDAFPWAHFVLAESYAQLGDWMSADAWLKRAARDKPSVPFAVMYDVALPAWQGQTELAVRRLRKALVEQQQTIAELEPEVRGVAGVHLARGGEYAPAIEILEPLIDLDTGYSRVGGGALMNGPHALAWAYFHTGADEKAHRVLSMETQDCARRKAAGQIRDNEVLYSCAENELLRGNVEHALEWFEQAVEAGWREYYRREHDPYWARLKDHLRYRALMAKVKEDVDRQRAEVARLDKQADFSAKLDAALAARARQTE
jgi:tetratricopeptide (TPR) repeat protein